MVSTEKIQSFIKNPKEIGEDGIALLKEAIDFYPSCGSLVVLYLNTLSKHNAIEFQEELNRLSIRISDKSTIIEKNLTNTNNIHFDSQKIQENTIDEENTFHEESAISNESKEESIEKTAEIVAEELDESTPEIEINWNEIESNPESDKHENIESSELSENKNEIIYLELNDEVEDENESPSSEFEKNETLSKTTSEEDELEKSITSSAIGSSYFEFNMEDEKKDIDDHDPSSGEDSEVQQNNQDEQDEEHEQDILTTDSPRIVQEKSSIVDENSTFSFSSWLSKGSSTEEEEKSKKVFVQVHRDKKTFYSPIENAKKSIDSKNIPISETLAQIYVSQGKISLAEEIYHRLSLLNPEKKVYFANLLKKLKKNK